MRDRVRGHRYVFTIADHQLRIWLLDLAREFPSARLDGYDISNAQFPPTAWIPANTTLACLDILKPIPEILQGKYDVVHVGLVVLVVEKDDPLPLLDNILALLSTLPVFEHQPCHNQLTCIVQNLEATFSGMKPTSVAFTLSRPPREFPAQPSTRSNARFMTRCWQVRAPIFGTWPPAFYFSLAEADESSWVRELSRIFQTRQLKVLDDKFLPIEDDIAVPWTLQHLMAIVEFIQTIDRPVGSAVDWWELYHRVTQDIRNGASMRMSMVSILGQKPLESETNKETEGVAANPRIQSRL